MFKETIEKAKIKFDSKFDYSKAKGTKTTDKITIICPVHGEFTQELRVHLRSVCGCKRCSREQANNIKSKTTSKYTQEAASVHKNFYTYDNLQYKNDHSKVTITCPVHGDFQQQAGSHLQGYGCKKCATVEQAAKQMLSTKQLKARLLHLPAHITVDVSSYKGYNKKLDCSCKHHGPFKQTLAILQTGTKYCPACANDSRGWKRSLYSNSPATLYVLKLKNGTYKVGLTKSSVSVRYSSDKEPIFKVLLEVILKDGVAAWDIEKQVMRKFKSYKYTGSTIFKYTGNSEVFTINPTNYLNNLIKDVK